LSDCITVASDRYSRSMSSSRDEQRVPNASLRTGRLRQLLRLAYHRVRRQRPLLGAAAAVFLALALAGAMASWAALIGFATLAGLFTLIAEHRAATDMGPPGSRSGLAQRQARATRGGAASPPPEAGLSWRSVIDAMADPALALDASGIVVHHNPPVAGLFPRVRAGQPISHLSRNPELLEGVDRVGGAEERVIVQLLDRVPVQRRVAAIITALSPDNSAESMPTRLVVFRDITEQEKLAQMRADFIAYASHELRTPLASLRGCVETLQRAARDDPVARERFLDIMAAQATRMTRLIDDLLTLSRAEMRVHVPPRGVVDLNEVIGFVANTLEPLAQASELSLKLEHCPGPALVRGEREELIQVFQNLVHNAIKYGRKGGSVEVRLGREATGREGAQQLAVSVSDDGPGIASEHLPRLTERFYRVSAAASREKGGTGLGLAIVKYIVNRHRGDLRISSTVGVGSTFTVLLDELPHDGKQQTLAVDGHVDGQK
jgi:two-component system, OmpR family, phosphate regulon sensor histidine kinase PhoR